MKKHKIAKLDPKEHYIGDKRSFHKRKEWLETLTEASYQMREKINEIIEKLNLGK